MNTFNSYITIYGSGGVQWVNTFNSYITIYGSGGVQWVNTFNSYIYYNLWEWGSSVGEYI